MKDRPPIGSTIEVDASYILGFDCGSRSWIEAVVEEHGPAANQIQVKVGLSEGKVFTIDYTTNSHGPSWRIPLWSPERKREVARVLCHRRLSTVEIKKAEANPDRWLAHWLPEAESILRFIREGRFSQVPK